MIRARSVAVSVAAVLVAAPAFAYLPTEHRELGDAAMQLALQKSPVPAGAAKLRMNPTLQVWTGQGSNEVGWFSFGELVATWGDLVASPDEMATAYAKNNGAAFKDIAQTENFSAHKDVAMHFMDLATVNETHFASKAVEAYVAWHAQALKTAAGGTGQLWQALQYEALALHSYTDLFAVGHMLTDRSSTMALEAQSQKESSLAHSMIQKGISTALKGELLALKGKGDDVVARYVLGFRTSFLHNGFNYWGAQVTTLGGDTYQLYGDHKLANAPVAKQKIEEAAAGSIFQVIEASKGRPPAAGAVNAALRALPVTYKGAARSVPMEKEMTKVLEALVKQRTKVVTEGGLDPGLLKKQAVGDGSVAYLAEVRTLCGASCR